MGRAAHAVVDRKFDTGPAHVFLAAHMIENDIRTLLDAPAIGADAPSIDTLEHTLTAGYAHAMALEAEQTRLQRRIADVAMCLADDEISSEVKRLGARLRAADAELMQLRALLASLRARAADARAAA